MLWHKELLHQVNCGSENQVLYYIFAVHVRTDQYVYSCICTDAHWPACTYLCPLAFYSQLPDQQYTWSHICWKIAYSTMVTMTIDLKTSWLLCTFGWKRERRSRNQHWFTPLSYWCRVKSLHSSAFFFLSHSLGDRWGTTMWWVLGNVAWRSPSLCMPDHSQNPPARWLALVSGTWLKEPSTWSGASSWKLIQPALPCGRQYRVT